MHHPGAAQTLKHLREIGLGHASRLGDLLRGPGGRGFGGEVLWLQYDLINRHYQGAREPSRRLV